MIIKNTMFCFIDLLQKEWISLHTCISSLSTSLGVHYLHPSSWVVSFWKTMEKFWKDLCSKLKYTKLWLTITLDKRDICILEALKRHFYPQGKVDLLKKLSHLTGILLKAQKWSWVVKSCQDVYNASCSVWTLLKNVLYKDTAHEYLRQQHSFSIASTLKWRSQIKSIITLLIHLVLYTWKFWPL